MSDIITRTTYIKIHNKTPHELKVTHVSDMEDGDFHKGYYLFTGEEYDYSPAKFYGARITAGDTEEMFIKLRKGRTNCPFRMTLKSSRGGEDVFKLNQKAAVNCQWHRLSKSECERQTNLRHDREFHKISTYVDGDYRMNIVVQLTDEQVEYDKEKERINKEIIIILNLIRLGLYKEALTRLEKLLKRAKDEEQISRIQSLIKRVKGAIKAEEKEEEAKQLMEEREYAAALEKFREAERTSSETVVNERVKAGIKRAYRKLHQDAILKEIFIKIEESLKNQRYNEAIKLADEGLDLADDLAVLAELASKKSRALTRQAREILLQGFKLEAENTKTTSKQARKKFELAKKTLEAAQELDFNYEQEEIEKMIELKISANELLYQAVEAEKAALEKFNKAENADAYEAARREHEVAIHMYEEAQRKVENGAEMIGEFQANVEYLQNVIDGAKHVSTEMIKLVLGEVKELNLEEDWRDQKGQQEFDKADINKEYFFGDLPVMKKPTYK